ncbi:hypothetical protein B0H14DRAFT_3905432 [Mycena olivaceomarginata]|nr:hypothetical protein B0H14DRAFT_3905432 [Mycena olivaceomarginata]
MHIPLCLIVMTSSPRQEDAHLLQPIPIMEGCLVQYHIQPVHNRAHEHTQFSKQLEGRVPPPIKKGKTWLQTVKRAWMISTLGQDERAGRGHGEDVRACAAARKPRKASANTYWMDLTVGSVHCQMQVMFTLREIVALTLPAGWKVVRITKLPGSLFGHIVAVSRCPSLRSARWPGE